MNNDSIALDLWIRFIEELRQSGCQKLEAEVFQPLVHANLEETLKTLKNFWAYATLFEGALSPRFFDLVSEVSKNPFAKSIH